MLHENLNGDEFTLLIKVHGREIGISNAISA